MAVLYAKNVTANWNVASSWSAVSSISIDDAGVPDTTTDCVFDALFTGTITLTASTTVNSVVCATGAAGTLTHNASVTLTIDGQDGGGDSLILVSTMTYTLGSATTSAITFTGAGTSDITTGGRTLGNVAFNNSGDTFRLLDALTTSGNINKTAGTLDPNGQTVTMTGNTPAIIGSPTFYDLIRTGNTVKTDTLVLAGNVTVTNTLTLNGNSSINRLLVSSNALGTSYQFIITGATVSASNVDFRDITLSVATNLSAITGGSGDCGGNSGITFTTADDWYFYQTTNGETINFSNNNYWYSATNGGGTKLADEVAGTPTANRNAKAILPQDNCYFDASSINGTPTVTVDQDMPRMCKTLDFTGVDAMAFHMNNVEQTICGGLIFVANVTLTTANKTLIFESMDRSGSYTFTPASATFSANIYIYPKSGTLTMGGNLTQATGNAFFHSFGTFSGGGYAMTLANYQGADNTRTLTLGNGLWTVGSITTNPWSPSGVANLTFNKGDSDIVVVARTNGDYTFAGSGLTYNDITINTGGNYACILTGSNTFNTFTINAPKTVKFTAGTTTTVSSFVTNGFALNKIAIASVTGGSWWKITKTGGGTSVNDYLDVTDSVGDPANTFYYGANGSGDAYSQANGWAVAPVSAGGNKWLFDDDMVW